MNSAARQFCFPRSSAQRRRRTRSIFPRGAARVALFGIAVALAPAQITVAADCWHPPVDAAVADPFRAPSCPWCAGNRGIEYDTGPGEPIIAVAGGVVTFSGSVAGTYYLVVSHADGLRATYGNITDATLAAGDPVVRGMRVGTTAGRLHFGLRSGDDYVDPTPYLGYLVGRARLIPTDGSPPRPAPPPVLRCGVRPPGVA